MLRLVKFLIFSLIPIFISLIVIEIILRKINFPRYGCTGINELGENVVSQFDDELGWKYTSGKSAAADYGIIYSFSKEGYRSGTVDKTTNFDKPRIIIIGDSLLFGHGLTFEDTFGYKLQKKLQDKYEVLNFAVQAYGTDQMYIMLNQVIPKYQPKFVIMDFAEDHPVRNVNRDRRDFYPCARVIGTKPVFEVNAGKLVLKHKPSLYDFYDNPRILLILRKLVDGNLSDRAQKFGENLTRALFKEINQTVEKHKAKLITIVFSKAADYPFSVDDKSGQVLGISVNLETSGSSQLIISETDHHPNTNGTNFIVDKLVEKYGFLF